MIRTENGVVFLELGTGDIGIANAYRSDEENQLEDEVFFYQAELGELGRRFDDHTGKSSDEVGAVVRMIFRKHESVQVLIDSLEHCKQCLIEAQK